MNPVFSVTLGYTPFIDALPIGGVWIPFMFVAVFLVAITYRAIRREDISDLKILLIESGLLGGQILGFLIAAAVVIWLVTAIA